MVSEKTAHVSHEAEIAACRKELFNLKLSLGAGQAKDVSQCKKIRRKIARLLTAVNANKSE